jgi:multiple antibiotic resistance protein
MVDVAFLWGAFIGLFAIMNPFSTAIVFLGLAAGDSEKKKKQMSKKASVTSAIVLMFFMLTGSILFTIFGITIEAFKIAGGLLIAIVGFNMLYPKPKQTEVEHRESKKKDDISIIPLAIPMLSGPGAITTALVWSSKVNGIKNWIGLLIIPILIALISYIVLVNAEYLKKAFGQTGTNVIEKLMGLIVLVMGVQFILNALTILLPQILN